MMSLYLRLVEWIRSEEGQDLVEYALILGLVALVAVVAIGLAGGQVNTIWSNIVTQLTSAASAGG